MKGSNPTVWIYRFRIGVEVGSLFWVLGFGVARASEFGGLNKFLSDFGVRFSGFGISGIGSGFRVRDSPLFLNLTGFQLCKVVSVGSERF